MTPEQWEQLNQLRKQLAPIARELTRLSERGDIERIQTEAFCCIKDLQTWYLNVTAVTAEYKKAKCSQCGGKPVYLYDLQGKVHGACEAHYRTIRAWADGLGIDLKFAQIPNTKAEEPKEVAPVIREVHKQMTEVLEKQSKSLSARLDEYAKCLAEGSMTPNDVRAAEGLPPTEPPKEEVPA